MRITIDQKSHHTFLAIIEIEVQQTYQNTSKNKRMIKIKLKSQICETLDRSFRFYLVKQP